MNRLKKNWLDKLSIVATSLCALHCLSLPLIIVLFPLLGASFVAQELFESVVLVVTMLLGTIALYSGYRYHHHRSYPFILLYLGGFLYWYKHELDPAQQPALIACAATMIILAHLLNIRLSRQLFGCPAH